MSTKPILVMMSYRGGERLQRCLESISRAEGHFSRIVLSVTSQEDSEDMKLCEAFRRSQVPRAEILCTHEELPTMRHQAFWVDYLEATSVASTDWIYWLAYDDEINLLGIESILDPAGDWPLKDKTSYFGPWAMRHEAHGQVLPGNSLETLEIWTCLKSQGVTAIEVLDWIRDQLTTPTYLQMSGSLIQFAAYLDMRDGKPRKQLPMRIEMAMSSCRGQRVVDEFQAPVVTIYGRPDSDRASYGRRARREDLHLLAWLARRTKRHPTEMLKVAKIYVLSLRLALSKKKPMEEWRLKSTK